VSLKRVLGPLDAAWLVAGNMIGAGIFWAPGIVAGQLPGGWMPLIAWTLGGLLALCGAAVYAELGARVPEAGGDYRYLSLAFGPLCGFLSGWAAMLLTFTAAAAAMTIVAVGYLEAIFPFLAGIPHAWVAALIILSLTAANVAGVRLAGRATAGLTAMPLLGLLALCVWATQAGDVQFEWPAATPIARGWPLALAAAMMPIYFTYSGWNAASYLAGELRQPQRTLPLGLVGGTLAVTAIYLMINSVLLGVVPQEQLAGSPAGAALAAEILIGSDGARLLAGCIALAVLGSVNVTLMAGSRIYYAMARDGLAPRAWGRTNSGGAPSNALWAAGGFGALLSLTGQVQRLVGWASLAILILSSLAIVALFILRRRAVGSPSYRCTFYPLTPSLYLVVSVAVAVAATRANPADSIYGVVIVLAGVPVFFWMRRRAKPGSV